MADPATLEPVSAVHEALVRLRSVVDDPVRTTVAVAFLVLVVGAFLVGHSLTRMRRRGLRVADAAAVVSLALNVVLFALALCSLVFSLLAFRSATESAVEQSKTLDASRAALQAMVERSQAQLDIQKKHFELVTSLAAAKPELKIYVDGRACPGNCKREATVLEAKRKGFGAGVISLAVVNTGTAPLKRGTVILKAGDHNIRLWGPGADRGLLTVVAKLRDELPPLAASERYETVSGEVVIPEEVDEWTVDYKVEADNCPSSRGTIYYRR